MKEEICEASEEEQLKTDEAENSVENEPAVQPAAEEIKEEEIKEERAEIQKPAKKDKRESVDEVLKNFESAPIEPPKKKKYGWVGTVLLLAVIAVGIYLMFSIVGEMGEMKTLGEVLAGSDWRYFLISIAVLLGVLFFDWMKYAVIMKTTTGKFSPRTTLKVSLLGKFYDNVTPFAAGGQPMQIYYLHKKGYSDGISSAVVLIKYFANMFCWTLICLLLMACNTGVLAGMGDDAWQKTIMIAAWIGLFVNMLLPMMVVVFAIFPRVAHALTSFAVNIGFKVKIVKDKEKSMAKAQKTVSDFRNGFKVMSRSPLGFIALILCCVTEVLLTYSLPFFVLNTFSALPAGESSNFGMLITVMALNVYAAQSVTVVPSPGNSGALEVVITKAFATVVTVAALPWAVLTWRFAVYYIYIVIGIGLTVFEFIRKLVRARRAKKAERNENAES